MPNGRPLFSSNRERRDAVTVILTGQKVSSCRCAPGGKQDQPGDRDAQARGRYNATRATLSAGGSLTKNHGLVVTSENAGDKRIYSIKA
jgi:hypothetical protein